ncbi:hypothetical protein CY35_07G050100 [Sphagnum magellanicum]|uniref:Uncharacterized protein n=1 Tax=Sphagnum magellanicum TaxID=128215 RepID=A0ACB8HKR2_9BRYO|nr:hypothetical protein CY35_07G050100 [Sphagnum magellanicum]
MAGVIKTSSALVVGSTAVAGNFLQGDEAAADGINMLVRVGIAVTCSVVAYTVSYFTTRGRSGEDSNPLLPDTDLSESEEGSKVAGNVVEEQEEHDQSSSSVQHLVVAPDDTAAAVPTTPVQEQEEQQRVKTAEAAPPIPVLGGLDQTSSLQPAAAEFNGFSSQESDSVKPNSEEGEKPLVQEAAEEDDDDAKTGNPILQKGSSGSSSYSNGEEKLAALETSSSTLEESSLPGWNKLDHSLDESKSDADANGRIGATHDAAAEAAEVEALRSTVHKLQEKEQLLEKQVLQYKQQLGLLADDDENAKKKERGHLAAEELAAAARPELKKEDTQTSVEELEIEVAGLRHANKELEQQRRQLSEKVSALQQNSELAHHSKGSVLELEVHHGAKPAEEHVPDMLQQQHVNEDLLIKQVEGLQNNWFSEVEELVYLRWVNACLRNELHNHQTTLAKVSALDLNKNSSLESLEKAKQLILEYINSEHLLPLQVKDYTEAGLDSSVSEKSLYFSSEGGVGDDSDDSPHSRQIHRKQSLIRRIRNWTARHLEAGSDLPSGPVSPAESERWFLFHSDPKHRRRSSGSKVPGETHLQKNASDMSLATSLSVGGRKIDSSVLSSPSPRRTTSDSSIFSTPASVKSDVSGSTHHKPNLPLLNTAIAEHNNPLNGVATSPFQLMAKSPASETAEKYPSVKDRLREAMERHKEIKEKARAERERAQKEKLADQPSTPQQPLTEESMSPAAEGSKRRVSRLPKPPPKPSGPPELAQGLTVGIPTTPKSPLGASASPESQQPQSKDNMQRAPEVVELYLSLMKQNSRSNEVIAGDGEITPDTPHSNTISETDNQSTHRLAIKADVETLGDFVKALATELQAAVYYSIEDVVAIVYWLDEELSHLVDEAAVLKHFDWPEAKVDALREATFEYLDLMKLQEELSLFEDKPELPCEEALKKILTTLEKVELSVFGLLRTRDMEVARYKEFNIPIEWMLDSGLVGKIKLECVKLAQLYINRVLSELDHEGESAHGEPMQEFLLLQGVRFAFRVHQFVGGFDPKTMSAFQALRDRAHIHNMDTL